MADLDLAAVRAFVTVVDEGQFSHAATMLGITQQAVSKRIAKLESQLGVRLFDRGRAGKPTAEGSRMLPFARSLLVAADETVASVRPELRPLRIAVLGERQAASRSIRYYLDRHPASNVEIVVSNAFVTSRDALVSGRADGAFARPNGGPRPLPSGIRALPAYLEPLHMLVGKDHPLAGRSAVTPADIVPYPVWVPGASVPSEWADYYREFSEFSGITIRTDPDPGAGMKPAFSEKSSAAFDLVLDRIAASDSLATFSGDGFLAPWNPNIRRLPIVDPTPAYPHALLWQPANTHPALPPFLAHFRANYNGDIATDCWIPEIDRPIFG
ncbi:DNA-binding transcriptional LysR family regulator [Nocardia tenerifensis]|uniref:DNA-binding transcriptional LysR family regulator n=1 Tax=Nocardia tenerifensis TaxID=228006 RepID=A0A318JY42_9NOCA|nr:LysR family transcriptional regulator [Nocardia tenerifensis]PXX59637.1 DNA-binding transcriptional LysR family regulator [Nocardia tenerifensis]